MILRYAALLSLVVLPGCFGERIETVDYYKKNDTKRVEHLKKCELQKDADEDANCVNARKANIKTVEYYLKNGVERATRKNRCLHGGYNIRTREDCENSFKASEQALQYYKENQAERIELLKACELKYGLIQGVDENCKQASYARLEAKYEASRKKRQERLKQRRTQRTASTNK